MAVAVLLLALIASSALHATTATRAAPKGLHGAGPNVFDITKFGVKPKDTETDDQQNSLNSLAFIKAWQAACHSSGPEARLLIPNGKFEVGPVPMGGPCSATVTVDIQGTLTPNLDGSIYFDTYWLGFENVKDVIITGKGTVDGNAFASYANCKTKPDCSGRPNFKFTNVTNALIDGVNSINPSFAHVYVSYSKNVTVRNMKMTAPKNSARTDGVFITESQLVNVADNVITTGTDCVAIAQGSKDITVTGLNCALGSGISIGSHFALSNIGTDMSNLLDVERVTVKKCSFVKTKSGLTIKTLLGAAGNKVTGVTFEDLEMDHVGNPINILQENKKNPSLNVRAPSTSVPAKLSDIHFKNIRGTSTTKKFVNLACSPLKPCEGIEISDVKLVFDVKSVVGAAASIVGSAAGCLNAKVLFNGLHDGINC